MNEKMVRNQRAMDYALYMIASSCFRGAVNRNKILEKKLLLAYKEVGADLQNKYENLCIKFMKDLESEVGSKDIFSEVVRVNMLPSSLIGRGAEIVFVGKKWSLSLVSYYDDSKKLRIEYVFESDKMERKYNKAA